MKLLSGSVFLLVLSTVQGLPVQSSSTVCEQFITVSTDTIVDSIMDEFKVTAEDLELLNPDIDFQALVPGTPVCVVGTADETSIGQRPRNLVEYQTTVGTDTCMSIIKLAQPSVSMQTFQELNANLNCESLEFQVGTVYLPSGTTVGSSSGNSAGLRQNLRASNAAEQNQVCIVGSWGGWTPWHAG